jgi:hypothetical protein
VRTWKEAAVACFKGLTRRSPEEAEENHDSFEDYLNMLSVSRLYIMSAERMTNE